MTPSFKMSQDLDSGDGGFWGAILKMCFLGVIRKIKWKTINLTVMGSPWLDITLFLTIKGTVPIELYLHRSVKGQVPVEFYFFFFFFSSNALSAIFSFINFPTFSPVPLLAVSKEAHCCKKCLKKLHFRRVSMKSHYLQWAFFSLFFCTESWM